MSNDSNITTNTMRSLLEAAKGINEGRSYPSPSTKTPSGGGTWTTKLVGRGNNKTFVEFYNKNGLVGSVYQVPDNAALFKAFDESTGREIASGFRAECKAAVEKLAA